MYALLRLAQLDLKCGKVFHEAFLQRGLEVHRSLNVGSVEERFAVPDRDLINATGIKQAERFFQSSVDVQTARLYDSRGRSWCDAAEMAGVAAMLWRARIFQPCVRHRMTQYSAHRIREHPL